MFSNTLAPFMVEKNCCQSFSLIKKSWSPVVTRQQRSKSVGQEEGEVWLKWPPISTQLYNKLANPKCSKCIKSRYATHPPKSLIDLFLNRHLPILSRILQSYACELNSDVSSTLETAAKKHPWSTAQGGLKQKMRSWTSSCRQLCKRLGRAYKQISRGHSL